MDLERIFTFIVIVIIWVLSNAVRKIAKPEQEDQAPSAQKPGLFKILQQSLAALEERSQDGDSITLDKYFQPQTKEPESLIEMAENAMQQREVLRPSAPPKAVEPRATVIQKQPQMTKRRKLQNAIIWAEILAPPVALRD